MKEIIVNQEDCSTIKLDELSESDSKIYAISIERSPYIPYLAKLVRIDGKYYTDNLLNSCWWIGATIYSTIKETIEYYSKEHPEAKFYMFDNVSEFATWLVKETQGSH